MSFLVLVIALVAVRFFGLSRRTLILENLLQGYRRGYAQLAGGQLQSAPGIYLCPILPAAALALLLLIIASLDWALLYYPVAFLVLLVSLGDPDRDGRIHTYLTDLRRNDIQGAYHDAAAFGAGEQSKAENWRQLHAETMESIGYGYFEAWFPVIFWFGVLGAPGALLYRACRWMEENTEEGQKPALRKACFVLEWLPLRLFGLTLALVGNFRPVFDLLGRTLSDCSRSSAELVRRFVTAAIHERDSQSAEDRPELEILELEELPGLTDRVLITWMAVIALLAVV